MILFTLFLVGFIAGIAFMAWMVRGGLNVEVNHKIEKPKDPADYWKDEEE